MPGSRRSTPGREGEPRWRRSAQRALVWAHHRRARWGRGGLEAGRNGEQGGIWAGKADGGEGLEAGRIAEQVGIGADSADAGEVLVIELVERTGRDEKAVAPDAPGGGWVDHESILIRLGARRGGEARRGREHENHTAVEHF